MFLKRFFYGIGQVAAFLSPKFIKSFHFVFELKICVFSPFYTVYCLLWHQTCFRLSQKSFKKVVRNDLIGTPMEMFSCGLAKCLRTAFLIKQLRWLLLCASNLFRKPCEQTNTRRIMSSILRSKGNQTMKFYQVTSEIFFFKNHAVNETGKLVPVLFLFFQIFIWGKSKWSDLCFDSPQVGMQRKQTV